jgi:hypothetical protein
MVNQRRHKAVKRSLSASESSWLLKMTGMLVVTAMVLGLITSFWLSWNIRRSLAELSANSKIREELVSMNNSLMARRTAYLAKDNFETIAAAKLDLYQPAAGQSRRP